MKLPALGLVALMIACTAEDTETGDKMIMDNSTVNVQAQERAGQILTALQSNIEQDVPAVVRDQEKIVAAVETAVLQPMEDALLGLDIEALTNLYSKDAQIDGMRVLDDAET